MALPGGGKRFGFQSLPSNKKALICKPSTMKSKRCVLITCPCEPIFVFTRSVGDLYKDKLILSPTLIREVD